MMKKVKSKKNLNKKSPPNVLKVICLLLIFQFALFIFSSVYTVFTISYDNYLIELEKTSPKQAKELKISLESSGLEYNESSLFYLGIIGATLVFMVGVFCIILSILTWRKVYWARITLSIFLFIFTFFSLLNVLSGEVFSVFYAAIQLVFGLLLLFNKEIKLYFKKN